MSESAAAIEEAATVAELEGRVESWPETASALVVHDGITYERAAELLKGIKALRAEIAASCDPVIAAAHKAHKAATTQKRELEAPLVEAERTIKQRMGAYSTEQERLARQEQARLAAEARKADEEARLREAEALEEAGEHTAAERVLSAPSVAPPPVVSRPTPKVAGVATRKVWKHRVVDFAALVRAVADGKAPLAMLLPNDKALGMQARSLQGELAIPGVEVYSEPNVSARSS